MFAVFYAEFVTRLLDQFRDQRIIDVTDFGEQMVLDLEVQSAKKPGQDSIVTREIHRRFDLMDGPRIVDPRRVRQGLSELCLLHAVRRLENDHQGEAQDERHDRREEDEDQRRVKQQRNSKCQRKKSGFTGNKNRKLDGFRSRHSMFAYPSGDQVCEVSHKLPIQSE